MYYSFAVCRLEASFLDFFKAVVLVRLNGWILLFASYTQVFKRNHGDLAEHGDDPALQTKEMKHITYVGLGMNVVLTGTKAFVGFLMNSSSLLADVRSFVSLDSVGLTLAIGYDF